MAAITDFADALQEQVTSGIKQAQEIHLAALEVARDFAALFQPTERGYSLPKGFPDATKVVDQVYGFAGKMLDLQHDYAVRVLEALAPAANGKA